MIERGSGCRRSNAPLTLSFGLRRIELSSGVEPQHRVRRKTVGARGQEELRVERGSHALGGRDLPLEIRSRRCREQDVAEGVQRVFESAALHRRRQGSPCRERRRQTPRACPHHEVVHGRGIHADRKVQARPVGGDHVVPEASRHIQHVTRLEHAIEHGRRRARRAAALARMHVERQRKRRRIHPPALLPYQLNREHVVRIPVLAERATPAERKVRIAGSPPTAVNGAPRCRARARVRE